MSELSSTSSPEQSKVPNVYTPSLEALNESIAMDAFNNFVNASPLAKDLDEAGKIALYLDHLKMQKNK